MPLLPRSIRLPYKLEPLMKAIFGSLLVLHCFCSNSHTGQILWRTWC